MMRRIAVALVALLISVPAVAAPISPTEAGAHVGQTATVEGVVSDVHVSPKETFINMGGSYPDNALTGVIFSENASAFPDVQNLDGKTVNISGTIQLYKGKPEIILRSAYQLKAR
jgi:DNA/RNA endonuclease YhcR with UshA esterase domain